MSRTAELEPRWLVGLIVQWATHEYHSGRRSLGWYKSCPMLKGGMPQGARQSYDTTGYSGFEIDRVGALIAQLPDAQKLAICWYFKVAMRQAIELEYPMHHNSRMENLRRALRNIEALFDERKKPCAAAAALI
jgi:hypothetical protein